MAYTTIDNPELYFQTKIFTGNQSTLVVTFDGSENLQPDLVWIKNRDDNYNHSLFDSVRGATKRLASNAAIAEATVAATLTAFNSNGFALGNDTTSNAPSNSHASWNWKTGTAFSNDASSTSVGSIDSVGSVNTDAGFSIMSYTGTGSAGTVAHGLGAIPKFIIIKGITNTSAENWRVFHQDVSNGRLILNDVKPAANSTDFGANGSGGTITQNQHYFSIGTDARVNADGASYIAYVFAEKQGYSKFASYTGNGDVNGTFVYTGFKPAFVIVKNTSINENWSMHDQKRNKIVAPNFARLAPDDNQVEAANTTFAKVELLSNGFKLGGTADVINDASVKFIFMAFAENPFVTSGGVPATAR